MIAALELDDLNETVHLIFKEHNEKARQFVGLHLGAVS